MSHNIKTIAFYLPQFHPIPENDEWWGKGFTEWTNTAKAKPLFRDHYQPHVPSDLGFYDLRLPETRIAQAEMAREYGIDAFCYYHYWFAGKRLLERPFNEVLESGQPDFPFCLCWANATWTGIWHGAPNRILIEQTYPGQSDYEAHFAALLPAFRDPRYITIDNKLLFLVYRPLDLPDAIHFVSIWRELATKAGLPGLFLVGVNHNSTWLPESAGFDAAVLQKLPLKAPRIPWKYALLKAHHFIKKANLTIYEHSEIADTFIRKHKANYLEFPCVIPNWDNTPRSGMNGLVLHNSTPELFKQQLATAIQNVSTLPAERRIIFLKSWNEWAEGNHLEPDLRFGKAYLEALHDMLAR